LPGVLVLARIDDQACPIAWLVIEVFDDTQRDAKRLIRIPYAIHRRDHVLRTRGPARRRRLRGTDLRKKQERRREERDDRENLSHIAPPHTCRRASTTGIRAARFAGINAAAAETTSNPIHVSTTSASTPFVYRRRGTGAPAPGGVQVRPA